MSSMFKHGLAILTHAGQNVIRFRTSGVDPNNKFNRNEFALLIFEQRMNKKPLSRFCGTAAFLPHNLQLVLCLRVGRR